MPDKYTASVIVPVLNEKASLEKNLSYYRELEAKVAELIFVDGGSRDGSVEWLQRHFDRVYQTECGRAKQMNYGAAKATQTLVMFLHADTQIPLYSINDQLVGARWGFYLLKLSGPQRILRLVEAGINIRSRVFLVATGDQCLFFNRDYFVETGGFASQRLMEDIEISRRFKRRSQPYLCSAKAITSSRRWEARGVIRTAVRMWMIQLLYKFGVSVNRLAKWYCDDVRLSTEYCD